MICTSYCIKIEEISDAIIRLADEVLPENRQGVNEYISTVWNRVMVWVGSINREGGTGELSKSHVIAEEAKLHRSLGEMLYNVDSFPTLKLVTGNGRVETVIPQGLFLLLLLIY